MRRWTGYVAIAIALALTSACAIHSEEAPTPEFVQKFRGWPAKKQVQYFNQLPQRSRMDLVVAMMKEGGEFAIPSYNEIKFFADGEFICDWLTDNDYAGGALKAKEFKYFTGRWRYEEGKIFLERDTTAIDFLSDGYTWIDARADVFQGKEMVFEMQAVSKEDKEPGPETLFVEKQLDSPAIRSYAEKKKKAGV